VFPENSTPHDKAVIFAYIHGYRTVDQIVELFGYKNKRPVEKVFKKHKGKFEHLAFKQTLYVGKEFLIP